MSPSSSSTSSSPVTSISSLSSDSSTLVVDQAMVKRGTSCCGSTVKFLCSYGGKILPRHPYGNLRYVQGENRMLAVDRSITFSEILAKMARLCEKEKKQQQLSLRCQLPTLDLDALVSITSDEDLANLIKVYDVLANKTTTTAKPADSSLKIRAFLFFSSQLPPLPKSPSSSPPAPPKLKGPASPPPAGFPRRIAAGGVGNGCLHNIQVCYHVHLHHHHSHNGCACQLGSCTGAGSTYYSSYKQQLQQEALIIHPISSSCSRKHLLFIL